MEWLLSERRDFAEANVFLQSDQQPPTLRVMTLDAYPGFASGRHRTESAGTMPQRARIRSSKYVNNVVEQDHRPIKHRVRLMLGFERFDTAAITISCIELADKIRKHQLKTRKLGGRPKTVPEIWAPVLTA